MKYRQQFPAFVCALSLVGLVALSHADQAQQTYFSEPKSLAADDYQDFFAQVAPNVYMAGQPSQTALSKLPDLGVTTVISLRTSYEMDNREVVPFDEAAALKEQGLGYVHIPLGGLDTPYNPEAVTELAQAIEQAEGNVLLHCTVAWRASHLWTAYLIRQLDVPVADAIAVARQLNFGDIPLEGFLGQSLQIGIANEGEQGDMGGEERGDKEGDSKEGDNSE